MITTVIRIKTTGLSEKITTLITEKRPTPEQIAKHIAQPVTCALLRQPVNP
jgi:hypothetical protein